MPVNMGYNLPGRGEVVLHTVEARGTAFFHYGPAHFLQGRKQSVAGGFRYIGQGGGMGLHHNQSMTPRRWAYVEEGENPVIFKNLGAGYFPADDFAENAVFIGIFGMFIHSAFPLGIGVRRRQGPSNRYNIE
jgi:hypothetical protein